MTTPNLAHDARASTLGTVYQLYVALQKCFELCAGQRVLIETLGDVTVSDSKQIEVKHYDKPLTDNHLNLWKTLRNWMQDDFDDGPYSALILYTTQTIGEKSRLVGWNGFNIDTRLEVLQAIYDEAEQTFAVNKVVKTDALPPDSLYYQRNVFKPERPAKLRRIIAKFYIEHTSPRIPDLHQRLQDQYCKSILRGKQPDFLNHLLGFVISPETTSPPSWEITFEQFEARVKELTPIYCIETRIFPQKYLYMNQEESDHSENQSEDPVFVTKIRDIQYETAIDKAIQDHTAAKRTILEEFRHYEIHAEDHLSFAKEVLDVFEPRYRVASRNMRDAISDAQNFYDTTTAEEPPKFPGFESTPRKFRNGVLHMLMDDTQKNLQWSLDRS